MTAQTTDNARTDLRTIDQTLSTGWRGVCGALHVDPSIEPTEVDPVSSDPADAALRQFQKTIQEVSS
jgi:hypothetical protein